MNEIVITKQITQLSNNEMQCYFVAYDDHFEHLDKLESYLSDDEVERAYRFHFEKHQRQFIIARGMLRLLLGQLLDLSPDKIEFDYEKHGRPVLKLHNEQVQFNLSHSGNFVLYAFAKSGTFGVDVEYNLREIDHIGVGGTVFTELECEKLNKGEKQDVFFTLWTCKEAVLKALGTGLSFPAQDVQVELKNYPPKKLSELKGDDDVKNWNLHCFIPYKDYHAAIAVQGQMPQLKIYRYKM